MSSTGKHFDETEWSQEVEEEEAPVIQPNGIYWEYLMSQGSQPVMNNGGGEKDDDSSGAETTSSGEEDETTDDEGDKRTTDVEGGNVTTDVEFLLLPYITFHIIHGWAYAWLARLMTHLSCI